MQVTRENRGRVFGWFSGKPRTSSRPKRKLPKRYLAPVADIVEQGLMVADVAVRMQVKNAIIMNALKRKADYQPEEISGMVRDTLIELAVERERDAAHISTVRGEIRRTGHSSWSDNDYVDEDNRTLRHRQQVYEQVAVQLRALADDEESVAAKAERARLDAWAEIGDSLKEKATHPYYSGGSSPEYQAAREERIQLLIQRDLTELMKTVQENKADASRDEAAREASALRSSKNSVSVKPSRFSKSRRSRGASS